MAQKIYLAKLLVYLNATTCLSRNLYGRLHWKNSREVLSFMYYSFHYIFLFPSRICSTTLSSLTLRTHISHLGARDFGVCAISACCFSVSFYCYNHLHCIIGIQKTQMGDVHSFFGYFLIKPFVLDCSFKFAFPPTRRKQANFYFQHRE